MSGDNKNKKQRPPQKQTRQPGVESKMKPKPKFVDPDYQGSNKLKNKIAIITGGDSGIGRAVAVAYAIEGADVIITYLEEHKDAEKTQEIIESHGRRCLTVAGDIGEPAFCEKVIKETIQQFKKIDILVNNSAEQHEKNDFEKITVQQLQRTFKTNVFAYFYMIKAALPYLKKVKGVIINTTSVTAYKGSDHLIDYAATKGAIVALTRSLSENLVAKGIRVNGVAPGPVWTPLIPASFTAKEVEKFGSQVPMKRAAEPKEIAPCYVFLASEDSSYMSGQVLHPNGGIIVNG